MAIKGKNINSGYYYPYVCFFKTCVKIMLLTPYANLPTFSIILQVKKIFKWEVMRLDKCT